MNDNESGENRVRRGDEKVAFYKLFVFADRLDVLLMITGVIGAVANGLTQPLMLVVMSQLINTFGKTNGDDITHEISKVCSWFLNFWS